MSTHPNDPTKPEWKVNIFMNIPERIGYVKQNYIILIAVTKITFIYTW